MKETIKKVTELILNLFLTFVKNNLLFYFSLNSCFFNSILFNILRIFTELILVTGIGFDLIVTTKTQ
ncbi:MAG TPA: hypothetical protein DCQ63_02020, partial [Planktothrix sp. UBA8402]|nr:hypothetical protein [Planktothrix sp. UBA8402]